ncbi:MAG: cytochrome P450 [Halioglobus sp.]
MSDIDFATEELKDLHEVLAELGSRDIASRILFAGKSIWLITGYDAVRQLMADDSQLSAPAAYDDLLKPSMGEVLATMTGAKHRRNRKLVAGVFFPKKMAELAERVFRKEALLLTESLRGRTSVDLVQDYTRPYTFNNITRLLGLPREDAPLLEGWASRIMHSFIDLPAAIAAKEEMGEYLLPLVSARRLHPEDDVISLLVGIDIDGDRLSDDEVFAFCRNLFPAAIDTSTNSLGSLLAVVLESPRLKRLALDSEAERAAIIEELLRWEPPLVMVPRTCVNQITLGGCKIEPGEDVRLCISAANNDPGRFPNPREFDHERSFNQHITFGHGEHFCLGTHMARRVLDTGLTVLLEQFPEIALDSDAEVEITGGVLRGPRCVQAVLNES